jgi:cysteine-rich repeat protein
MRKIVWLSYLESARPYAMVMAFVATLISSQHSLVAQSTIYAVDASKCATNIDCPPPIPRQGQDPRCLESVCNKGMCGTKVRVGHTLDGIVSGGDFACFSAPLICDASGKATVVTDSSRLIPAREGQHCIPPMASNNPCVKPVCRNKLCVHEPNDDAGCPDSSISVTDCERRGCRNGTCQALPDPKKQGNRCGEPQTAECRTTKYACSDAGKCEATQQVAENAECADEPLVLGASKRLPAAFKNLVVTSALFPKYGCDLATCKIQFCGDGVINRDEECDGRALPSNITAGRRCNASCKVE